MKPTLSPRGVSQRLAHAGHNRCRRDASAFAGFTSGYEISGTRNAVFVRARTAHLHQAAQRESQMLDQYAEVLSGAGFAVEHGPRHLIVTLPEEET